MTTPLPIEICRPGRFTSVQGAVVEFTDADIAGMAASYDYDSEPAPLVTGHPKLDAPAYGWAGALSVNAAGVLVADPVDLEPAFAEAVGAKRYRRVSPEFYPPTHPANPRPGAWYLKHIGFLGAAAPAIRGLRPVSFSEAQASGAVTIDLDPQELAMPPEDQTEDQTAAFAEREAAIVADRAALDAREQAIAAREAAAAADAAAALHQANVSFAEGLVAGGKLKAFGKDKIVGLLDTLSGTDAGTVSFGEGVDDAPIDIFKELLTAADPFVSFGELAPPEDEDKHVVSFAAPAGITVDGEGLELLGRAKAYQAQHPAASLIEAVKAVS